MTVAKTRFYFLPVSNAILVHITTAKYFKVDGGFVCKIVEVDVGHQFHGCFVVTKVGRNAFVNVSQYFIVELGVVLLQFEFAVQPIHA